MQTEKFTLTQADVKKLMSDPSCEMRAETTEKIAAQYERKWPRLSDAERKIAEDIFRSLTNDLEVIVRQSMVKHLKNANDLPRDLALSLARDVDAVALPMIKVSEVFSDDDLLDLLRDESPSKQIAVAQRDSVSGRVADALIDTGNEKAVARLVANEGADLDEQHFTRVMEEYESSESVSDSFSRRPSLPPRISEQLVHALAQKIETYLVQNHDISPDAASNIVMQARERATVCLLSEGSSDDQLNRLVEQLHVNNRLTPTLILRAICMGDLPFFEVAIARLSKVPLHNARILIHDNGVLGLKSLYARAGLPEKFYPAIRAAVNLHQETDYDGEPYDRERFVSKMIERMLTQFEEPNTQLTDEDIDYLIGKLNTLAA